jgi:O-antigen/teichoic acid export membrane protein
LSGIVHRIVGVARGVSSLSEPSAASRSAALRAEFLWVAGAQLGPLLAGLFAITVLTRLLGPEGYGKLALGLSIVGVLNLLIYGPVAQTIARFYAITRERGELRRYLALVQQAYLLASGAVLVALAVGVGVVNATFGGDWARLLAGSGVAGVAAGATAGLAAVLNAMRWRKAYAVQQATESMLRPLLAAALVLVFSREPSLAILGYAIASILVAIPAELKARRGLLSSQPTPVPKHTEATSLMREMMIYGGPFAKFGLVAVVGFVGDRWLLLAGLAPMSSAYTRRCISLRTLRSRLR